MRQSEDAMGVIRGELCDRLEALRRCGRRISAAEFVGHVDAMRSLAAAYGLLPVVRMAEALERAVAENGSDLGRCPTALYLSRLGDAIGCERLDEGASQALLASVSVQLSA